ncbi:MAG: cobalt-precorrin-5B (C(1))-methyltransferase CbiD [Desulfovibrio sp.]|jgi:cobalt-precorrin-5B (C1)-methyltransferase|nr:cobalt-precorrin-5B (C(1))-methyltransferase CbiD [Desulfovibrio sp.]
MRRPLRDGFTTGTAATGAAMAALSLLLDGTPPERVQVPLPPLTEDAQGRVHPRGHLSLEVEDCSLGPAPDVAVTCGGPVAHGTVRKDGGDDPDVTHGALIHATVALDGPIGRFAPESGSAAGIPAIAPVVRIEGGPGIGRVTLPGLPVPVGEAAINPVPRAQLRHAMAACAAARPDVLCPPLTVVLSVPEGERLASRTLGPRLGIRGGISILGTQGTSRPFSHDAWRAAIDQALAVARHEGTTVCLSTGRRSEALLQSRHPGLAPCQFVQAGDMAGYALEAAGRAGFERIAWGCFFGKLLKFAQGMASTHVRDGDLRWEPLALRCRREGVPEGTIQGCTTAAAALERLLAVPGGMGVVAATGREAALRAGTFAGRPVAVHLFTAEGICIWES